MTIIVIVHEIDDLNSDKSRTLIEYVSAHSMLPDNPMAFPSTFIAAIGKRLCHEPITISEKKGILLLLAHHGSQEAVDAIEAYMVHPDASLVHWGNIALDEGRQFIKIAQEKTVK